MRFDRLTVSLLVLRPDAPDLDATQAAALQDAHMSHLADLHKAGVLVAAGPLLGDADPSLRGLSLLTVEPEEARRLKQQDPAVRAGLYEIHVFRWIVPSGAISFAPATFPRSMSQASE
jgi:uncharacterized protein